MAVVISRRLASMFALVSFTGAASADCPPPACFRRPVLAVVPFAAGGPVDAIARFWAEGMTKALGQQVIIENAAGGLGAIGMSKVAKAAPDSHTLLITSQGPISITPALVGNLPLDPAKDLMPSALIATSALVLVVRTDNPARSLQDLLARARQNPSKLTYASSGNGSLGHLVAEQFAAQSGVKFTHVPYKGGAPALNDLAAGSVDFMLADTVVAAPLIKQQKLRPLAVASQGRIPILADVATFSEHGVQGLSQGQWIGAFFPAGTAPSIASRLNTETRKWLAAPEVREKLAAMGMQPGAMDTAGFAELAAADRRKWLAVVKQANIKAD